MAGWLVWLEGCLVKIGQQSGWARTHPMGLRTPCMGEGCCSSLQRRRLHLMLLLSSCLGCAANACCNISLDTEGRRDGTMGILLQFKLVLQSSNTIR
jgi:hypothetical protein